MVYALGVHDGRGCIRVLVAPLPLGRAEDREDAVPKSAHTELSEVLVDGGPRRELTRQRSRQGQPLLKT
jgi:hypothetical protein